MQRLIQDILFDNFVTEICKSELALAFLMRFPNYTQLHQGPSQSVPGFSLWEIHEDLVRVDLNPQAALLNQLK